MNPVFSVFGRDCMARAIDIARYGRYTTGYNPNRYSLLPVPKAI